MAIFSAKPFGLAATTSRSNRQWGLSGMHRLRYILPLALVAIAAFYPAWAQQQAAKRHYVVSYVDSLPNFAPEAAMLLQQYATDSRKDPGIVRIEVLRDISR